MPKALQENDEVVFLLGAGFSSPMGLPVMVSFVDAASARYFKHAKLFPPFLSCVGDPLREAIRCVPSGG